MDVKYSLKKILSLMTDKRTYTRTLSAAMTVIMTLQLAATPVSASHWEQTIPEGAETVAPGEPALKNTFALVVATGGQPGDAIQYFKVIYEDTAGIRRSEYILKDDNRTSFALAQEFANRDVRRNATSERFVNANQVDKYAPDDGEEWLPDPSENAQALRPETRDTYLFETVYDVNRIVGVEIMHNAGQWDCQGLWIYQVDQIYGEEMYAYVSDDSYIGFSGWRLAELEMNRKNGQLSYTTLQNSRPKLYRMGEDGHLEFNLITYDRSEAEYEVTNNRKYAVRIDITDIFGAGIENAVWDSEGNGMIGETRFFDALELEIRYLDTYGCVQNASAKVLPSFLLWALDNGVSSSDILGGFALQGDTLLVPVTLPFFADLLGVTLSYAPHELNGGPMNLSSISMYDLSLSLADVTLDPERAAIVPSITYNPIYLWRNDSRQGHTLNSGDAHAFDMKFNEDGVAMVDEPLMDEYLVEITTDTMPSAGTIEDVSILLNYKTYSGMEQRTEKIMLREQSKDFHGYTSGAEDLYYWLGMRPGGTLHFRIKIPYVSEFTGATLELEGNGNDEWQMGGLKIYRLDEVSKRKVTWGSFTAGGVTSDRYYDRTFKGDLVFSGNRAVLVQKGEEVTLDTGTGGGANSESTLPDSSVAWADVKYSMSYEEALQDIGFTKTRNIYDVEVTVAGNSALAGTEDAGSKNQFYFQLIFQEGNSGYVLANQQLSGDGFRAGYTETFTIRTNQDYGELVSVRIIPEDNSSKSDYFDKLNIDSIQVLRRSDGGLSRQWSLERVGWIDIDYRDEGAASGMMGQEGRTEEEMARSFNVTYNTYAVNLMVSVTTLGMPFSGSVQGDICYYNSAGEAKHKSFDMVALMYEYANKTPRYNTEGAGADSARSDTYMFRADRTDRFVISLSDACELAYLELDAYMDTLEEGQGGTWHIGGVAVSLIESQGSVLLNQYDEYERDNTVQLLTTNVDTNRTPAYQLLMEHNARTSQKIYFIEHEIELDVERDNVSVLSREPISQNDVLNIYVYPNLEESESSEGYTVQAAATYTSPRGMLQASAGELTLSNDGSMFYALGVKASGMTVLNELSLQVNSNDHIPYVYIDRAIVQQVRSGVIINTYEFDFGGISAAYGLTGVPLTEIVGYMRPYVEEQVVMFSIGEGMEEMTLLQPETKDLAVALTYIPEHSVEGYKHEFDTPFIYLTDQQISTLKSGQVVTMTFNEDFVKEVTGVVMVATGGLAVPIDMACVGTYRVVSATDERIEQNWYSFSEFGDSISGVEVGRVNRRLGYNGYSVKPLKLRFTTAPASADSESGVNGAVEMTISYLDDDGTIRTRTIPDLRLYATTESPFATDTVTEVELLVDDMKTLRWLEVRPYDDKDETDINWRLSSVSVQLGHKGEVQKRSVDSSKVITESAGRKINFSNIGVQVKVTAGSATGTPTEITVMNETEDIFLSSGQTAQLTAHVVDSYEGYTVTVERASGLDSTATADASNFLTQNGDTMTFYPDRNYTGADIYYRITVTSVEVGTKTVINFVQGFEKEPEPVVTPVAKPEDKEPAEGETEGKTESAEESTETGTTGDAGVESGTEVGSDSDETQNP